MSQLAQLTATSVFSRNLRAYNEDTRFIINQGGTRSSKTWSILQLLFLIARSKNGLMISVVSETMPHLRRGAMRDFEEILTIMRYPYQDQHNKSNNIYTIHNSRIEFFSADDSSRLRGAARDILFINECNNLSLMSFNELEVRTRGAVFLDFNPVGEFWLHSDLLHRLKEKDYKLIKSTYRDNEYLTDRQVESIESRKDRDPNWWRVYGLGEVGQVEGLVFPTIELVDEVPDRGRTVIGMDFGFSNDPTAIVQLTVHGSSLYIDELCYQTGMTNGDIANLLRSFGVNQSKEVIADSAEPKSIEELYRAGFNIHPSTKGADSVRAGIDAVRQYDLKVTKRSVNVVKELRNYKYKTDKDGKLLNDTVDYWNHSIDAIRYGVTYMAKVAGAPPKSSFTRLRI